MALLKVCQTNLGFYRETQNVLEQIPLKTQLSVKLWPVFLLALRLMKQKSEFLRICLRVVWNQEAFCGNILLYEEH